MNVFDLLPRGFAVLAIQFHCCPAGQPSLRSVHDCRYHLQITQQVGTARGRDLLLHLPLCFEKQLLMVSLRNRTMLTLKPSSYVAFFARGAEV